MNPLCENLCKTPRNVPVGAGAECTKGEEIRRSSVVVGGAFVPLQGGGHRFDPDTLHSVNESPANMLGRLRPDFFLGS